MMQHQPLVNQSCYNLREALQGGHPALRFCAPQREAGRELHVLPAFDGALQLPLAAVLHAHMRSPGCKRRRGDARPPARQQHRSLLPVGQHEQGMSASTEVPPIHS